MQRKSRPKQLIGWTRIELRSGESKEVAIPVSRDRLTVFDEASDSWKLVPGTYVIPAGSASQDLPLQKKVEF
jgi:beta-glucosidase